MTYGPMTSKPGEDILDSRDLIERMEYLAASREELDDEERAEFRGIRALAREGISDWEYGETFIHERYFKEYAEQLADDIGAIDREASWPMTHIDWDAAAASLKQDYSEVEFCGHTYYVRY